MSSKEKNKDLIKLFIDEVFNQRSLDSIDKYHATNMTDGTGKTLESFKKSLAALFSGFPDLRVNIEHLIAEDNLVAVFLEFTGTNKGQFEGKPPTNKQVKIRSADLYRIENGRITRHWDVVDRLNLMQQTDTIRFNQTKN